MTSETTPSGPIVVTGAGSGIGAALTDRLVALGQTVIGLDRNVSSLPSVVHAVECDLADPAAVAAAAADIAEAAGPAGLRGLANIAGVPGSAPAEAVYAVNVIGLRSLTRALQPIVRPGSAIVLLSSMAGYRGSATPEEVTELLGLADDALRDRLDALGHDGPEAYQLSKQLIHQLTLELAAQLHPSGVRAVSVSPGPVETPILADFRATMPSLDVASQLVGRNARPDEVAAVVEFVLSGQASWLNGVDLRLDGGLTALRTHRTAEAT